MKLIIVAVLTYLAVPSSATSNKSSRIVGGEEAQPHSIPFQVGLLVTRGDSDTRYSGSLLSNTRTLTCARCVFESTSTNLRFGSHNFKALGTGEIRHTVFPASYRIHPWFNNPAENNNNIAVLIHPHVAYTPNIQPALLATGGNQFIGTIATLSGWGDIVGGGSSESLRVASNIVISNAACEAIHGPAVVFAGLICVNTQLGGIQGGICNGDLGGPLFTGQGAGVILIGVANFFSDTTGCEGGVPAGYARITHHATWIYSHM